MANLEAGRAAFAAEPGFILRSGRRVSHLFRHSPALIRYHLTNGFAANRRADLADRVCGNYSVQASAAAMPWPRSKKPEAALVAGALGTPVRMVEAGW